METITVTLEIDGISIPRIYLLESAELIDWQKQVADIIESITSNKEYGRTKGER